MLNRAHAAAMLLAALVLVPATPAAAIDGEILITHAKALAGNITPGDKAGYPVTLSLPGSYKFASNLTVPAGAHGILAANHDITIDFAGFRLWSNGGAINGIVGYYSSLTIKNGTIAAFRGTGIYGTGHFWTIDNMRIVVNGDHGISAPSGRSWSISNSQIAENGGDGINGGNGDILIRNNAVNRNLGSGIRIPGGHIEGNIVGYNQGDGIAIDTGTVLGNTVIFNTGYGLSAGLGVGYGNNNFTFAGSMKIIGDGYQLHPNSCSGGTCP